MAWVANGLEKSAALCAGLATIGFGSPSGTIESVTAAAGLAAFVIGRKRQYGAECGRIAKDVRRRVRADFERLQVAEGGERGWGEALVRADERLADALRKVVVSPSAFGECAVSRSGFVQAALKQILSELRLADPGTYGRAGEEGLDYRYARTVLSVGLDSAACNPDFYRAVEPSVVFALARSTGELLSRSDEQIARLRSIGDELARFREDFHGRFPEAAADGADADGSLSPSIRANLQRFGVLADRLTAEQFRALDLLRRVRRVRITGCAGSGKTLVACEKATRLAKAGVLPLVLCHSPHLARYIASLVAGSGVRVATLPELVRGLVGDNPDRGAWSLHEAPTSDQLDGALRALSESGVGFDAVLVDEGQDFEEEWWIVVEALLRDPGSAQLYIFHDDHQSLHVGRSSYPFEDPIVDISRNCRNSARVLDVVRYFHPSPPEIERELASTGFTWVLADPGLSPRERVSAAVRLGVSAGLALANLSVITVGGIPADELVGAGKFLDVEVEGDWRATVGRLLTRSVRADASWSDHARAKLGELEGILARLSRFGFPTGTDREVVMRAARACGALSHSLTGVEFGIERLLRFDVRFGDLDLVGPDGRPASDREIVAFLSQEDWPDVLPPPLRVELTRDPQRGHDQALPVLDVCDAKGLESDVVVVVVGDRLPVGSADKYIVTSRARFGLIVHDDRDRLHVPRSPGTFFSSRLAGQSRPGPREDRTSTSA